MERLNEYSSYQRNSQISENCYILPVLCNKIYKVYSEIQYFCFKTKTKSLGQDSGKVQVGFGFGFRLGSGRVHEN